jgi:hypothetical protein
VYGVISPALLSVTPIIDRLLSLYDLQVKNGDLKAAEKTFQYAIRFLDRQLFWLHRRA